ncbi:strawberry notch-like NTP hydrolase domain-containing protein [Sphingomonas carotinifaciens]|uniref:C-terminal domain on Strawberry notch homologue n=1 Tax=Sphingomonas carotinifaciens TaxID=1166323 RepID=A0A1G7PXA4_9SPHN|nr:strawberry notch family protein [Sphingomonas carotinifaciens]MBB4087550.1 putative RNA methylase [Sphingomonas carotinifaciens]MWC45637.1 methylase [Sphingomonas carotinifaciens]SDF90891.1 C-terminal domain on Strawberry notch homologue [Sphingomonas carotinifaciens]
MSTSAAAANLDSPELDFTEPSITAARAVAATIARNGSLQRDTLLWVMEQAYGGSSADGRWSLRNAYDMLELAEVLHLLKADLPKAPDDCLEALNELISNLPTHTVRSEEQIELQQFSTPAPIAYLAVLAARIARTDLVLEPSAGTGLLATFAFRAGARLVLNEIDPRRADLLTAAFPGVAVTRHDAELIHDLLPPAVRPTAVLINPPFSRSIGRHADPLAALRHLRSALLRMGAGGRCAAILPDRVDTSSRAWAKATEGCTLTLHLELPANAYAKHGTSQPVKLMVLEKVRGDHAELVRCASLGDALTAIVVQTQPAAAPVVPAPTLPVRAAPRNSLLGGLALKPRLSAPLSNAAASQAALDIGYTVFADPLPTGEAVGVYLPYRPSRIAIACAGAHPTALVESIAMGSITAPRPSYVPTLSQAVVETKLLSDAQLETLVYSGDAFERDLPGRFRPAEEGLSLAPDPEGRPYRTGFFLGDGTGVGKGRQIASIILDQWLRGRRKHIWISKTETLLEDARRDWTAIGGLALDIQHLNQWKLGTAIGAGEGILFLTYATLRSNRGDKGTRLQQILDWVGDDYAGMVVFDEAHEMAGVAGGEGRFGTKDGSDQGIAGVRLQNLLPRARVLYVSATGASDVNNLAYATRLGLWGPGTAFADRRTFVDSLRRGGIAAMELIARDLKMQGLYVARALSFAGVEYDVLEHSLTPDQIEVYDAYADAWAIIHANLRAALDATRVTDSFSKDTYNSGAKAAALSIFELTKQRFFCQLLLGMKLPALVPAIRADLDRGESAVIQLVSTSEAMLDRALAALTAEDRANLDIELSPREFVMSYLTAAFPVRQMKTFVDDTGKTRSEPMSDADGRPVLSQEALSMRETLIEQLCALPVVGSALDHIIGHFGTDAVAEVTGRSRRIILDAQGRQRIESRSARTNLVETDAFMRGAKKILIFSDAGGTGRSYHASLTAENKTRRNHYLLEPGWRADAAIQGLGRTHRTHQASAPLFRPVSTDCRGERRFISTIARRLDSLGALTRGQRQTGGQGLFDPRDNLESDYAKESLEQWFRLLADGKLRSVTLSEFQRLTGLELEGEGVGLKEDLPPIQRWLNRILALRIALQNAIFDEYLGLIEARVEAARAAGTLDVGVESINAERITILDRTVIRRDQTSGAETEILRLETEERYKPVALERALRMLGDDARPIVNRKSGKAAIRCNTYSLTDDDGEIVRRYELIRPTRTERMRQDLLAETMWEEASEEEWAALWKAEADDMAGKTRTSTLYLVTGLLLPVWDRLPDEHVQVWRLNTDDGQSLLGRIVPAPLVAKLADAFGCAATITVSGAETSQHVMTSGEMAAIGAYRLKRSLVAGQQRLELLDWPHTRLAELKAAGCFTEIIQHKTRMFVPVATAAAVIDRIAA